MRVVTHTDRFILHYIDGFMMRHKESSACSPLGSATHTLNRGHAVLQTKSFASFDAYFIRQAEWYVCVCVSKLV